MNDIKIGDPVQPQDSSQNKEQLHTHNINCIMQKNTILVMIGILLLVIIAVSAYFLGYQKAKKEVISNIMSTSLSPSPIEALPSPVKTIDLIKLANAWNSGTKTYSNSNISITFDYPAYFEKEETDIQRANKEWADKYKDIPSVKQPLYRSNFSASFYTPNQELSPNQEFCDNKMSVSVKQYDNSQNLSLYDFIADLNKIYPGDGRDETFEKYKIGLKPTTIPKVGSYTWEGIVRENPIKTVYFTNKRNVYTFGLIGNCHTGGQYTPDAEKILQNMLNSIKFL